MTIRKLNYTGRQRIRRADVDVTVHNVEDVFAATASVEHDLSSYDFPPDAGLVFEAYRKTQLARMNLGGLSRPLSGQTLSLAGFPDPKALLFRLKIVAAGTSGLLLGEADELRATEGNDASAERSSLLLVEAADLGDRLWWLDLSDTAPRLQISASFATDFRAFARRDDFTWFVYPVVLRLILEREIESESAEDDAGAEDGDAGDGASPWLQLGSQLAGRGCPEDADSQAEWIEDACDAFCRRHRFKMKFRHILTGEVG